MTPTLHIKSAVDIAIARGIGRFDAAPPIHRLLWALGVHVRPPHYASFGRNALIMGGFWGAWILLFGAVHAWYVQPQGGMDIVVKPISTALLAAVFFGLAMATVFRFRARKARLPGWDEVGSVGLTSVQR